MGLDVMDVGEEGSFVVSSGEERLHLLDEREVGAELDGGSEDREDFRSNELDSRAKTVPETGVENSQEGSLEGFVVGF